MTTATLDTTAQQGTFDQGTPDQSMFDQGRADAFAERVIGVLNGGAIALMTSIGHRTGLFDTMAGLAPSTADEVAAAAGLHPRYVREWLGAMVTGGFVEVDPDTGRYRLPREHAASLTRESPLGNIAVYAQYIPQLGAVEDRIVACFQEGGGVPYEAFTRFHDIMAEDSGQTVLGALIDRILPLAPGVVERLDRGIDVVDIGCGSGRALNLMARTFPNSRFTGYDLSEEAIRRGRMEAARHGTANIRFAQADLTNFAEPARYDLVTAFDAIHDQKEPATVLAAIARALRPGGTFLMQDIRASCHHHNNMDHPIGPLLYTVSCMHCMTVSLAQGGQGFGAMWGEETALSLLREVGLIDVAVHQLPHDLQNNYYVCRRG